MLKILLVDDDESNRLTMSALLEDEGYDVAEAESFSNALSVITNRTNYFDIVLLDHSLGDGFGADLVPLIRHRMPNAKIVALSGSSGAEVALMRADLALTKGMHFPEMLRLLRQLAPHNARSA